MSLTQAPHAIGSHVKFFPIGNTFTKDVTEATVSATPASKTAKPGATDSGWLDFGAIDDFKVKPVSGTEVDIWGPSPGQLRKVDKLLLKKSTGYTWTAQELSALVIELIFGGAKGLTGQFTPLEGVEKRGWLKWQGYDEADNLLITADSWGIIKPTGDVDMGGGDIVKAAFEFDTLFSTLNTSALA